MTPFAAGALGLLLGFVLRSALDIVLEWRSHRPAPLRSFDDVRVICGASCDVPALSRDARYEA